MRRCVGAFPAVLRPEAHPLLGDGWTWFGWERETAQKAGEVMPDDPYDCPGCGVPPGRLHADECEMEQCPACGWQRLSCGCGQEIADAERLPWTGLMPGAAECREYGLWSKLVPDRGWVPCWADEPGACEDVLRLQAESRWDRERRRWVRTSPPGET